MALESEMFLNLISRKSSELAIAVLVETSLPPYRLPPLKALVMVETFGLRLWCLFFVKGLEG